MMKNKILLIIENNDKWNALMNSLVRCAPNEELSISKQLAQINEELRNLKEIK